MKDALKKRKVTEVEGSEKISIRSKSVREPQFAHSRDSGNRDFVLPGNKDYKVGDLIPKPQGGGGGGRGGQASPDGSGEDDFVFTLSKDEFLDLFFEDLKLPNLIKTQLKDLRSPVPQRAGYTTDGPPAKLNRVRTMRRSLARRIALRRPKTEDVRDLEEELALAEAETPPDEFQIAELKARLQRLVALRRTIAYVDPLDLQYNRFDRVPKPATQAVMFCLMDASASMTEPLKDLAKRFFMLLHVFLSRHYREVDVVFIRHTSTASEVDEETFFRGVETGGTVISTALEEMDTHRARPLFARGLEHLRGAGVRRRQYPRRHGPLHRAGREAPAAGEPVFRLYRGVRAAGAGRDHRLARLQGSGRPQQAFRHAPGVQPG